MKERKPYLDWLRVIAIALVIYNHLPAHALSRETGSFLFVFPALLAQINVPLFLMVSGALLLGRDEDTGTLLKKRVLRIAVVLPVAYLGLYLLRTLHETVLHGAAFTFSLHDYIYGVFSHQLAPQDAGSYWFLYAYLGYLLMLPFLRGAAKHMRRSHMILLTAVHAGLCTLLPAVNVILTACGLQALRITGEFSVPLAAERILFYPLAGYWLAHGTDAGTIRPKRMAGIVCAALCGAAAAALLYGKLEEETALFLTELSTAMAVFLLARWLSARRQGAGETKTAAGIRKLSGLVFGIYLLDPYLKLTLFGAYYKAGSLLPEPVCSLLWIPVSMAAGGFLTWMLKKIPSVKRFL